jgi:hypothetical protein
MTIGGIILRVAAVGFAWSWLAENGLLLSALLLFAARGLDDLGGR